MAEQRYSAHEDWSDNALVNYLCSIDEIQSQLPKELSVVPFINPETNESHAVVSIWYFYQANARTHPHIMPKWVGYLGKAPDVHIQTYVKHEDGREGLFCFKIWMGKSAACWIGRNFFKAPMFAGNQSLKRNNDIIEHKCDYKENNITESCYFQYKLKEDIGTPQEGSFNHFVVNKFARRQFTYYKEELNSIPNVFEDRSIIEIEVMKHESNLLETVLHLENSPFHSAIAFSDTACDVLPSE